MKASQANREGHVKSQMNPILAPGGRDEGRTPRDRYLLVTAIGVGFIYDNTLRNLLELVVIISDIILIPSDLPSLHQCNPEEQDIVHFGKSWKAARPACCGVEQTNCNRATRESRVWAAFSFLAELGHQPLEQFLGVRLERATTNFESSIPLCRCSILET